MLPNDNVSMSVRHLDHVLIVYTLMKWPGNHLVPCVAEFNQSIKKTFNVSRTTNVIVRSTVMVGSCIPIHACRCLPDPKCVFYPSGLLLCFSVDHFCLVPVPDMVLGLDTDVHESGCRWFPGHVLHRAVNNQDVIKMSDGHRNVVVR